MTAYYNSANAVVSSAVVPPTLITQPLAPPHQMNGSVHLEEVMAPTVVVVPLPQPQPTLPHTMQTLSAQQQPPPMSSLPTSHLAAPVHAPVVIQDESEDDQELGPNEEVGEVETLENLELEESMESKHESQDETHLEPEGSIAHQSAKPPTDSTSNTFTPIITGTGCILNVGEAGIPNPREK
ncbi:unnamed protein product, partial [Timema podura]|nr:unnamed protein product [Timema podura]